jgi:hypothetical protein
MSFWSNQSELKISKKKTINIKTKSKNAIFFLTVRATFGYLRYLVFAYSPFFGTEKVELFE